MASTIKKYATFFSSDDLIVYIKHTYKNIITCFILSNLLFTKKEFFLIHIQEEMFSKALFVVTPLLIIQ